MFQESVPDYGRTPVDFTHFHKDRLGNQEPLFVNGRYRVRDVKYLIWARYFWTGLVYGRRGGTLPDDPSVRPQGPDDLTSPLPVGVIELKVTRSERSKLEFLRTFLVLY